MGYFVKEEAKPKKARAIGSVANQTANGMLAEFSILPINPGQGNIHALLAGVIQDAIDLQRAIDKGRKK